MNNTKEKFDLVYASTQSLRDAKRETIHFMGRVGRRFKKLRYPPWILFYQGNYIQLILIFQNILMQ